MNFEDNFFDVIIFSYVLEYIEDDRKAIHELFRVLKPKGFAILQVSISKNAKETFESLQIFIQRKEKDILSRKTMLEYMTKTIKED